MYYCQPGGCARPCGMPESCRNAAGWGLGNMGRAVSTKLRKGERTGAQEVGCDSGGPSFCSSTSRWPPLSLQAIVACSSSLHQAGMATLFFKAECPACPHPSASTVTSIVTLSSRAMWLVRMWGSSRTPLATRTVRAGASAVPTCRAPAPSGSGTLGRYERREPQARSQGSHML